MNEKTQYTLGIDIGSTTVKIAILNEEHEVLFSDYERHFANIQETLSDLLGRAVHKLGMISVSPVITGSGGLTLAKHLEVPFVQEVIAVSTALQDYAPQTDVAIELGGEDAKIIYFEDGNVEQRMNGICAGGTGSFIDQMASLLQTDAMGLNEYAKNYQALYTIAARCGVFAKSDIQPLINEGATKEDLSASIFQAVVNQTISGLACGKPIRGHVAFLGGPLHFLSDDMPLPLFRLSTRWQAPFHLYLYSRIQMHIPSAFLSPVCRFLLYTEKHLFYVVRNADLIHVLLTPVPAHVSARLRLLTSLKLCSPVQNPRPQHSTHLRAKSVPYIDSMPFRCLSSKGTHLQYPLLLHNHSTSCTSLKNPFDVLCCFLSSWIHTVPWQTEIKLPPLLFSVNPALE